MNSDCWIWQGAKDKDGYGSIKLNGCSHKVHRISFVLFGGHLEPRQMVCHRCDMPSCWNPKHLFAGFGSDNMKDAYTKGRHSQRGERNNGKKLSGDKVDEILRLRSTGEYTQKELGKMFGVTQSNISSILLGKSWLASKPVGSL